MIAHSPELIETEFGRCASLRWEDAQRFTREGVPCMALIHSASRRFDFVLRDRVSFDRNQGFEFERHCRGGAVGAYVLLAQNEWGELVDIIAFRGKRVARWLGRAAVLGAEQIDAPRMGEPLVTHESLLDWLRAGRRGIVVVDDRQAAHLLQHETLQVETSAFARTLQSRLTIPAPRIATTPSAMMVAA